MGSQDCRTDTFSTFVLVRKSNLEKYTNWRKRDEEKNCNWSSGIGNGDTDVCMFFKDGGQGADKCIPER